MDDPSRANPESGQPPIVIRQGGSSTGIGLVIAALILAGGAVWAVSIWSETQLKMIQAPAEAIKEGLKSAAEAFKPNK